MLSIKQIKLLRSLHKKKGRDKENLFLIEGEKLLREAIQSNFNIKSIYCIEPLFDFLKNTPSNKIDDRELKKISSFVTPNKVVAVIEKPKESEIAVDGDLYLALDGIKDPGNFGTLIRLAEWFGASGVICSNDCVDTYNPKAIQATMGSIFRTKIYRTNLNELFKGCSHEICGAVLDGENIYSASLQKKSIVVIGNESHGISKGVNKLLNKRMFIPRFSNSQYPESLNAANAAAILLSNYRAKI